VKEVSVFVIYLTDPPENIVRCFDQLSKFKYKSSGLDVMALSSSQFWNIPRHAWLEKGLMAGKYGDGRLMVLEEGDWIPPLSEDSPVKWQAEGSCSIRVSSGKVAAVQLVWNCAVLMLLASSADEGAQPEFIQYSCGDLIIEEGAKSQKVFSLIDGEAEVIHSGKVIATISAGELFGTFAVLTGEKRSAEVRATKNCSILAFSAEEFEKLIKSRPEASLQLMRDMARQIKSLNVRLQNDS